MKRKIYNIDSLELTKEQEQKLKEYITLIKKICHKYANNNAMTTFDDLVQEALIKIAYTIKSKFCINKETEISFYYTMIKNSCLSELRNNKFKNYMIVLDEVSVDNKLYNNNIDENIINEDCYKILSSFPISDYEKKILIHSLGINTFHKTCKEIGEIMGKKSVNIRLAKSHAVKKIRQKIMKDNKNINTYAS